MARLFIIGNGFDLAHGFKTRYSNFRDWMRQQLSEMGVDREQLEEVPEIPFSYVGNHGDEYDQRELIKLLMWLLVYGAHIDEEWNEFEDALYNLDLQAVMDEATMFIDDGINNEDYSLSENRRDNKMFYAEQDYQMYAEALRDASVMIKKLFSKWIDTVSIDGGQIAFGWDVIFNKGSGIRPDDIFVSFNYTETLEKIYAVPETQVYHIHGYRKKGSELVVGHGDDESRNFDTEHIIAADLLEEAIRNLRKDTDSVIRNNSDLWQKIRDADISEVYSFGFSFNAVDLPYINRISWSLGAHRDVVWYLNARDHGEKNDRNRQVIQSCGFTGAFDEYDASKLLIHIDSIVPALMDEFDRDEKFTFYYDESNFCGKFYHREKDGAYEFNSDMDKDFILAGIVSENPAIAIDKKDLLQRLGIQETIKEIKFKSQFSEGDFISTIHKKRSYELLRFIDEKGLFIHIAQVNVFYYAVVDIVDSILDTIELDEYAQSEFQGDLRYANNHLKQLIYKTLHEKADDTLRIFREYGYPDIVEEDTEDFCNDIAGLFGERWSQTTEQKFLSGMIRKAGRDGEIIFLRDNDKDIMVDDLAQFYLHFIGLFQNSEHIFDEQKEVKRWIDGYIIIDENDMQVTNFKFVNSKTEVMIQLSDVISGLCGQMYEYLNKVDDHMVVRDVRQMDDQQLRCAKILCSMVYKSSERNKGFIFSITAQMIRERFAFFANRVICECNTRGF